VQLLVSEGADKEKATSDGGTPLLVACHQGHLEVVQLLVSEGARRQNDRRQNEAQICQRPQRGCDTGAFARRWWRPDASASSRRGEHCGHA
jgi:ankyrin repeat protein